MSIPPPTLDVIASAVLCGRRLVRRIDRDLSGQGLTWGRFHVLVTIQRHDGWIHAGSVARRIGITRQSAHASMQQLDERGFLRWKDEGWIRSAQLTSDGHDAVAFAWGALSEAIASIERVSVEERRMLVAAHRSIAAELRRPPQVKPAYWDYLSDEIKAIQPRWFDD